MKDDAPGLFPMYAPRRERRYSWESVDDFAEDWGWWFVAAVVFVVTLALIVWK
jgi:hypothetical protein